MSENRPGIALSNHRGFDSYVLAGDEVDFGEFIALFGDSLEQPLRTVSQEDISALQATLEQRHGIRILECGRRPCPPSLTSSNTILKGTQNPKPCVDLYYNRDHWRGICRYRIIPQPDPDISPPDPDSRQKILPGPRSPHLPMSRWSTRCHRCSGSCDLHIPCMYTCVQDIQALRANEGWFEGTVSSASGRD